MADLSLVTDNYLPTASETFSDNLSGSITAGAGTVPVNSAAEYADGQTVVLTVEPGTSNEATFVGKKDVGVNQFIECIWTEGNTAVGHDAGATIIDYDSATHYNLLSKALQLIMNQDGTLKDTPIRTALGLSSASTDGWEVFPYTFSVSSGYNKGNGEYDITVANQDVTSLLTPGMRLRLERSTAAPTQCADLEASSSQYASRASGSLTGAISTMTDDFTVEVWAKPESYGTGMIFSRYTVASDDGMVFQLNAAGQAIIYGAGTGNRTATSSLVVNLGKWTHLAGTLDMSAGTSTMYFNGISVTTTIAGAGTSFTQSGDMMIGRAGTGTDYFDGKLSDLRVWNVVRTATQIKDNYNQQLVGNETNLVGYWKLNGDFNDSTASANHLTGSGGAVATNVDNPMKSTEYAIVTKVAYSNPNSTVTVFTGTSHNIPNMTLNSPYYSTQKTPFGFTNDISSWSIESISISQLSQASPVSGTWYNLGSLLIPIPTGSWEVYYSTNLYETTTASGQASVYSTLSTANNTESDVTMTGRAYTSYGATIAFMHTITRERTLELSAATNYYLNSKCDNANGSTISFYGTQGATVIRAVCAYL